eukprot:2523414-Amphidinium_carterae.1
MHRSACWTHVVCTSWQKLIARASRFREDPELATIAVHALLPWKPKSSQTALKAKGGILDGEVSRNVFEMCKN